MAYCITQQWSNSTTPQAELSVNIQSQDGAKAILSWSLDYVAYGYPVNTSNSRSYTVKIGTYTKNGTCSIGGVTGRKNIDSGTVTITKTHSSQSISFSVSFAFNLTWSGVYGGTKSASSSISVGAKYSYKVTYNVNGGSGSFATQTKWYGETLKLHSGSPTRTGYSFQGWGTSASDTSKDYAAGADYTSNAAITLYAIWKANTYTVTYNANGGTGAPSNQTKTYGVALTLSSTKPTRTDYNFLGWGTSASATTATYSAGAKYTANSSITLYAVWELAYVKPRITDVIVERCTSTGTIAEDGTYISISFNWECDQNVTSITIEDRPMGGEWESSSVSASGKSGSVSMVVGDGDFSVETSYEFRITVTDTKSSYEIVSIPGQIFPLDFRFNGKGVGIGKPADEDDLCDIGYRTRFYGGLLHPVMPEGTDLNELKTPNTYVSINASTSTYSGTPTGLSGTFTLEVLGAGAEGQIMQRITRCNKTYPLEYIRFFYQSSWGEWVRKFGVSLYAGTYSSGGGTITLNETAANFDLLEIFYTDNNNVAGGSVRVYGPQGRSVTISAIEASSGASTYIRRTKYTINGTAITPDVTNAGHVKISNSSVATTSGTNFIRIIKVLGYHDTVV